MGTRSSEDGEFRVGDILELTETSTESGAVYLDEEKGAAFVQVFVSTSAGQRRLPSGLLGLACASVIGAGLAAVVGTTAVVFYLLDDL